MITKKKADNFFKREIESAEIETSAHYTYRDGFRLGFGFFIGLAAAGLILFAIIFIINYIIRIL